MSGKVLVYRKHLVVGNDTRVLQLVPGAHQTASGAVVVPHHFDTVRLLRNLGYLVESPIVHEYDWCGTVPFEAQKVTAAHITMHNRCFVLNGLGTGKTRALLFAFDYLKAKGLVDKLLVVAPLSTLRVTWQREVSLVMPHLRTAVLHGQKYKRLEALNSDADVYLINHDGVEVIEQELVSAKFGMICIDELTAYKTRSTDRWRAMSRLLPTAKWRIGMTGTPMPQSPLDAYGQIKLLGSTTAVPSLVAFRDKVMFKVGQFKWLPRKGAEETVLQYMQPAVRFSREECLDLPPVQYIDKVAPLSTEQLRAYNAMARDLTLSVSTGQVTAINEADKINKLLQIALGVVYTADRRQHDLPCDPRLLALEEVIEQSASKVLVFTPYKSTLRLLHERLSKRWTVEQVSGDTSSSERDRIFGAFQLVENPHVIVAHPACMAHGLTLTAASTVVWYGPPMSLELYEQANARITRSGQKHSQLIVNMASTRVEERIYERLRTRAQMQGLLLSLFEQQVLADQL